MNEAVGLRVASRRLAIAATFTVEPVGEALEFWLRELGDFGIEYAPFGQVFQSLLDPGSVLGTNANGVNVLALRAEDWPSQEAVTLGRELASLIRSKAATSSSPFVVVLCPSRTSSSDANIADAERAVRDALTGATGVYLFGPEFIERYGVSDVFDVHSEKLGGVPYTPEAFAALATVIMRATHALVRTPLKVIAVDADETLWKGVVGEDGVDGVVIDAPRRALQQRLVDLQGAGIQICIVSKNEEADVLAVFDQRADEMILRREHVTAFRVNWRPKSGNIRGLAQELGLGLDAFVFLDDNPIECGEVKAGCPDVCIVQVPKDDAALTRMVDHVWAFDRLGKLTAEDKQRAEHYRATADREQLRDQTENLADFLKSLRLEIDIRPMTDGDIDRVAQLTQRTNQFNTTTVRRRAPEVIAACTPNGSLRCLVTRVKDRFGDYGLVGAIFFEPRDGRLWVDSFMLSCRALGRGVEHAILSRLAEIAESEKLGGVDLPFVRTARNEPAEAFLDVVADRPPPRTESRVYAMSVAGARAALVKASSVRAAPPPSETKAKVPAPSSAHSDHLRIHELAIRLSDAATLMADLRSARVPTSTTTTVGQVALTPTEQTIAEIWRELFATDDIGPASDFFEIGGHSLLALRMLSRVADACDIDLPPLRLIFDCQTLAELASAIDERRESAVATTQDRM